MVCPDLLSGGRTSAAATDRSTCLDPSPPSPRPGLVAVPAAPEPLPRPSSSWAEATPAADDCTVNRPRCWAMKMRCRVFGTFIHRRAPTGCYRASGKTARGWPAAVRVRRDVRGVAPALLPEVQRHRFAGAVRSSRRLLRGPRQRGRRCPETRQVALGGTSLTAAEDLPRSACFFFAAFASSARKLPAAVLIIRKLPFDNIRCITWRLRLLLAGMVGLRSSTSVRGIPFNTDGLSGPS